ncbi:MAG: outer membrane lipoprotein [Rhodocyclaceae bacterium]
MIMRLKIFAIAALFLMAGCAEMQQMGGSKYGDTSGAVASQTDRNGRIASIDIIKVDEDYKLGLGTAVGAVAGGLLGSQIGEGRGSTVATVLGAAAGAAAGTAVESKMKKKDAQQVNVQMDSGGRVTIVQPVDGRLAAGMKVRIEGSGESARVVPR